MPCGCLLEGATFVRAKDTGLDIQLLLPGPETGHQATHYRVLRRDGAFATEPLTLWDVWHSIAIYLRQLGEMPCKEGNVS